MIEIITELQAIAQIGITYSKDYFDTIRYKRILEICSSLLSLNSNHKYDDILEVFTKESGYATPKIDVRGALFKDNKILLVREKSDNLWSLPGGWADVNISPSENIIKEIKEETGYGANVIKLIGIFDRNQISRWPHYYKIFFLCEITSLTGSYCPNEILEIGFFDSKNIPPLSICRVNNEQIEKCFLHHHNPNLKTEFD